MGEAGRRSESDTLKESQTGPVDHRTPGVNMSQGVFRSATKETLRDVGDESEVLVAHTA